MDKSASFPLGFGEKPEAAFLGRGGRMDLNDVCVESVAWRNGGSVLAFGYAISLGPLESCPLLILWLSP